MLSTLKNNQIVEYFMDTTYSCVPPSTQKFKHIVLSSFLLEAEKTVLSLFILVSNEKEELSLIYSII